MFDITTVSPDCFNDFAIKLFQWQLTHVPVYRDFVNKMYKKSLSVTQYENIPFLPIQFFKTHRVIAENMSPEITFTSSGTGGTLSSHYVAETLHYHASFTNGFYRRYGHPDSYCIIALLPSYLERSGSSLIYMMQTLIKETKHPKSGFFINQFDTINQIIIDNELKAQKTIILGVTYALLDWVQQWPGAILQHTTVIETGGMKGQRKEMLRNEVHGIIGQKLGIENIHSEYGMTELLSQAYSHGKGLFDTPPWMRVLVRDPYDPAAVYAKNKYGAINIIDLANQYSCAFIATDDLGFVNDEGQFTISGRSDNSDIRGCNLMIY